MMMLNGIMNDIVIVVISMHVSSQQEHLENHTYIFISEKFSRLAF